MLKLSDLALRPDFQIGPMLVSPSRRLVEGPGGFVHVEPLIMQVFLLLLDGGGKVVTRNELFDQVWGGVMVGDDSLNRAVAKVRKIGQEVAPGLFEIETIPRTGYRLTGDFLPEHQDSGPVGEDRPERGISRRALAAGGAAVIAIGGAGYWWLGRNTADPRVTRLVADGKQILSAGWYDEERAIKVLDQAVALDPSNAEAWGLLAVAQAISSDSPSGQVASAAVEAAEHSAQNALRIDPREPNALTAMIVLQSDMLDWAVREDRYRRILDIAPDNTLAMRNLGQLLHGVGRCRESYEINERAIAIDPVAPAHQYLKAMRLWVLGRTAEADRVSNRTMELWPSHPIIRMARLMIYAFTGRTRAALAIVEDEQTTPRLLSPAAADVWRVSLTALETHAPSDVAAARQANLEGSKNTPAIAAYAILILSALGELDAAFEVANGFLLGRGTIIVRPKPVSKIPSVNAPGWRNTYGLFTPPTKAMRLDPRFRSLADDLGLTEYWRKRGIGPDAFLFKA